MSGGTEFELPLEGLFQGIFCFCVREYKSPSHGRAGVHENDDYQCIKPSLSICLFETPI